MSFTLNRDEKGEINGAILSQNGQELRASKLKEETIVTIDPAIFDNYSGKYRFNATDVVTVFRENNKFFAQPTGQPKLEMLPLSETEFLIKEINARLTFVKDASGKAGKINLFMNGGNTEMPRVE